MNRIGHLVVRSAALILGLGAAAAAVWWASRLDTMVLARPMTGYAVTLLFICLASLGILFGARSADRSLGFLLALFAAAGSLFAADLLLSGYGRYLTLPSGYDKRSKLEVALDLRASGVPAYPSVHPAQLIGERLIVDGVETMPMSGMADTLTVFCNEVGEYYIYESDERGFKNPRGSWAKPSDLVLIGDSFTQGYCIPNGKSYPELLRAERPSTLNISQALSGPLIELAMTREFLPGTSPSLVYWFYFEGNDIPDLSRELSVPVLRRYLDDPSFSQRLVAREKGVQAAMKNWMERKIELESSSSFRRSAWLKELPSKLLLSAKLWHVRSLAGLVDLDEAWPLKDMDWSHGDTALLDGFRGIVEQMSRMAMREGGELVFVYLPGSRFFTHGSIHPWRERVLESVRRSGVPIVDLFEAFRSQSDPIPLFTIGKGIHYTERGNALVASEIAADAASRAPAQPAGSTEL